MFTKFLSSVRCKYVWFFVLSVFIFSLANAQRTPMSGKEKATTLLKKNSSANGLDQILSNGYMISDAYEDKQAGIFLIYLQQMYQDIPVYNKISVYAFKNDTLIHNRQDFVNTKMGTTPRTAGYSISPEQAIGFAAKHLSISVSQPEMLRKDDLNKTFVYKVEGLKTDSTTSTLVWQPVNEGSALKLAWNVHITAPTGNDDWFVRIDAQTGEYLGKNNVVIHEKEDDDCASSVTQGDLPFSNASAGSSVQSLNFTPAAAANKVFFAPPPSVTSASYRVYPLPLESPNFGLRSLITNPWQIAGAGNNAITNGWHFDGTNNHDSARGNNVWVREDTAGKQLSLFTIVPGGLSDISSTRFPALTFDRLLDFTVQPGTPSNLRAGIDNLFYMNNAMHDISYQYGFDEPAGNFQANNLGRGGLENDYVNAFAADGARSDNADFSTPSDGTSPMMRMFLWTAKSSPIFIDGSLDNGIIGHEYGHGISGRLTGGPTKIAACLNNAEQGGEGWSDYMALMVTTNWANATAGDGANSRTIGSYVLDQPADGLGLRRFPYSTDMSINPLTYDDLALNQEVHKIGEVWCAALWDMTWNIIQQEGIDPDIYHGKKGNNIALQLVILGMKLQPCGPGFLDARDAILKADSILYDYKHRCAIWNAFARRGMGKSASQGQATSLSDQVSAIDIPHGLDLSITADKTTLTTGDNVTYTIKTRCQCAALDNATIVDTLAATLTYISSSGGSYTAPAIRFNGLSYLPGDRKTFSFIATINNTKKPPPDTLINDTRDQSKYNWNMLVVNNSWQESSALSHSPSHSWHAADTSTKFSIASMSSNNILLDHPLTLSFWHRFNTTVLSNTGHVEISTDAGATWTELGPYMTQNSYAISHDPLNTNLSFTGNSGSSFVQTIVSLANFESTTARIRFSFYSSGSTPNEGWYVDDIVVTNKPHLANIVYAYNGTALLGKDSITIPFTASALPVHFISFDAQKQNNTGVLHWKVSNEININNYIVQKSPDGINFSNIGEVAYSNAGGNEKDYYFTDNQPLPGNNYYRIAEKDLDGKLNLSAVKTLRFDGGLMVIKLQPVPAFNHTVQLTIENADGASFAVSLLNAVGQAIKNYYVKPGVNQLDLQNFAKGIYYLKIQLNNGTIEVKKLVIE